MKIVFYALMIPLAFVMGKVLYEPFFGGDGGEEVAAETVLEIKVKSPMGTVTEVVDLEDVDPKDFPEKVVVSDSLILTDKNGLSPLKLDPGSPVKPLALEGMMLQVTSPLATHLTGEIPVLDSNFAKEVAIKRMARRVAMVESEADGGATEAKVMEPKVMEAEPVPVEVAEVEPEPAEMTKPEPEPETDPVPEPKASASLSAEQIVAAMKESLAGGSIKELDAEKVTSWEAVGDESFDGEEFQVGIATYKEMTILGEKTLQAKALFKKGQLEKWIHAKTGMAIR